MSTEIHFTFQPKKKPAKRSAKAVIYDPDLPGAPWWREYTAENNAEHMKRARATVLHALARHREAPRGADREYLRDQVAYAVDVVALGTDLPLEVIMDALTPIAELTAEEMASPHWGRTPWRERILREAGHVRKDAFWHRMRTGERHPRHRTYQ